ncbi:FUN14 family-domain-containing protein [Russula dissimulans]|nr:FUN14 family-domain-containing protein [Russula dissimulans]
MQHVFLHQAAPRRNFFYRSLRHATHPLQRAPITSPLRARPFNSYATLSRVVTGVGTGLAGAGLGLSFYANLRKLNCERQPDPMALPPPPESIVNMYELTFGTVCGVCAGVFIKKGAKALAWLFGGVFVFLQYLGTTSIIKIDWSRAAARFEGLFYTVDAQGTRRPPNVYSIWRQLVDFLTADFQPRASFIAGLVLGLRIG